ncbi:hypothetical protein [Methylobacterium oryzisoli]|uniref:hypothetical protein n=1 Tax=Methylobacterium oryzisoli TaxID=3385502 RepID=UPI00389202B5
MPLDQSVLTRVASLIRDEINDRHEMIKIIAIHFDTLSDRSSFPSYRVETCGGTAEDRCKLAAAIVEAMNRYMRQFGCEVSALR